MYFASSDADEVSYNCNKYDEAYYDIWLMNHVNNYVSKYKIVCKWFFKRPGKSISLLMSQELHLKYSQCLNCIKCVKILYSFYFIWRTNLTVTFFPEDTDIMPFLYLAFPYFFFIFMFLSVSISQKHNYSI